MAKATRVPITGTVLGWAIQEAGLGEGEIARRLKVDTEAVRRWVSGEESPTKTQFGHLVAMLKRPSAVFFLPDPPQVPSVPARFRKAPDGEERFLKPGESRWLRTAQRLQTMAAWLGERLQEKPPVFPKATIQDEAEQIANTERTRVGVSLKVQHGWSDAPTALREWRNALEAQGLLVFQAQLGVGSCRGFSLWNEKAPVIAVNSAYNESARIYTLFHEYGHLLLRTDAVCDLPNSLPARETPERWSERFSAAFLMPWEDFVEYLQIAFSWREGHQLKDFEQVQKIANRYKVSLRAAALRLVEIGAADHSLYEEVHKQAPVSEKRRGGGGGKGLRRHERRVQEYGKRLPRLLIAGMRKEVIGAHDVLEYMDVATIHLSELEEMVGPKG